jgi:hypothetical protein
MAMKQLDRLNEYVLITTVMVLGILLAIICGRLSGTGNTKDLIILAVAAASIITCLWLRTKIWVLIPMFWEMAGQLNSVPFFRLPLRDVVVVLVVVFFFTLKAFKIVRARPVYSWLDALMAVNLLYVLSCYLRNPVGLNVFGSDLVGGRPYLEIIFALTGYWVINQAVMSPRLAFYLPLLFATVPALLAVASTITFFFPAAAPILGKLYSGVDADAYYNEQREVDPTGDPDAGDSRAQYLAVVGSKIFNLLCGYFSPLTFINPVYVVRFLTAAVAFYFCLKSGHRITIPYVTFVILLSTYFRKGMAGAIILGLIAIPPFIILIAGQGTFYKLPDSAQRTLSMFPGKWDQGVVDNAENSTGWRVQMWDIVLHDPKYIHNKTFGDGFGFTKETLEDMGAVGSQEDFMLVGDVHSGPVSAIRTVGYIGLGLFILLLFGTAVRAWRLIRITKGTPFYPLALFLGVPLIYTPFGFIFVFGAYGQDLPNAVMSIGFLNLLSNAFTAYRKKVEEPPAPTLPSRQPAQPLAPIPVPALNR